MSTDSPEPTTDTSEPTTDSPERTTDARERTADARAVTVGNVTLDARSAGRLFVGAVVLGGYAAWAVADVLPRWMSFPAVALVAGYLLSTRGTPRAQWSLVGYGLAALLAVTPLLMVLPDARSAGTFGVSAWDLLFLRWNLYLLVAFLVPAAVVAALTARFDGRLGST